MTSKHFDGRDCRLLEEAEKLGKCLFIDVKWVEGVRVELGALFCGHDVRELQPELVDVAIDSVVPAPISRRRAVGCGPRKQVYCDCVL